MRNQTKEFVKLDYSLTRLKQKPNKLAQSVIIRLHDALMVRSAGSEHIAAKQYLIGQHRFICWIYQ